MKIVLTGRNFARDKCTYVPFDVFPFRDIYLRLAEIYWKSFYYRDSSLIDWHELLGNFYPLILPSNRREGSSLGGEKPVFREFFEQEFSRRNSFWKRLFDTIRTEKLFHDGIIISILDFLLLLRRLLTFFFFLFFP